MMIALWVMLATLLFPYALVMIAKGGKGYDNADPRNEAALDTDLRKRAFAAHQNAIEAIPFFGLPLAFALGRHVDLALVETCSIVWIVGRILFAWAYLTDRPTARSLLWGVSALAALTLMIAAAVA